MASFPHLASSLHPVSLFVCICIMLPFSVCGREGQGRGHAGGQGGRTILSSGALSGVVAPLLLSPCSFSSLMGRCRCLLARIQHLPFPPHLHTATSSLIGHACPPSALKHALAWDTMRHPHPHCYHAIPIHALRQNTACLPAFFTCHATCSWLAHTFTFS